MKNLFTTAIGVCIFWSASVSLHAQDTQVNVDHGKWEAQPLIKKYGVNIPFDISLNTLEQNIEVINDLQLRSVRIHNGWGLEGTGKLVESSPISISDNNVTYDFTAMDRILNLINGTNAKPTLVNGYGPQALSATFNAVPEDLDKWEQVNKLVADHIDELKIPAEIEVWDGGDHPDYFNGGSLLYTDVLKYAFNGLKNHRYVKPGTGGFYELWNWEYKKIWGYEENPDPGFKNIMKFFSAYIQDNSELDIRLNEPAGLYEQCNDPGTWEAHGSGYSPLGKSSADAVGYKAACALFEGISYMNRYSGLTQVYLDQLIDDNNGVKGLISQDGKKSPLYFALKLYNEMPFDRNAFTTSNPAVNGMASSNETLATIAVWNTGNNAANTTVNLSNLPFTTGKIEIYRIDSSHSTDGTLAIEDAGTLSGNSKTLSVTIPENGLAVIKITKDGDTSMNKKPFGNYITNNSFWWFKYTEGWVWQAFDPYTVTAFVGDTIGNDWGIAYSGAYFEKIPQKIRVKVKAQGNMTWMDENTALYMRVDFESYDPDWDEYYYDYAVVYADNKNFVFDPDHGSMPDAAGKGGKESAVVNVDYTDPEGFVIDVSALPLQDYSGNACFIFYMQNPGSATTGLQAKFELSNADGTDGISTVTQKEAIATIYPTRITDMVHIDLADDQPATVEIYNTEGKTIYKNTISTTGTIDVNQLNPGLYLIKVNNESGSITQKVIK